MPRSPLQDRDELLLVGDDGTGLWRVLSLGKAVAANVPRFAGMTDTHLWTHSNTQRFVGLIPQINQAKVVAVLHLGDLTDDNFDGTDEPTEGYDAFLARHLGRLDAPWFQCLGNHDAISNAEATAAQAEYPDTYKLDYNDSTAPSRILSCGDQWH